MKSVLNIDIQKVSQSRLAQTNLENVPFGRIFTDHMLIIDCIDGEWQTPQIRPYGPISFHPSMSALHYGQAFFEGMKAHRRPDGEVVLFRPDLNAKRLNHSARRMAMPEIPEELFMESLMELLKLDKAWTPSGDNGALYIRPFMFATEECVGVRTAANYRFMVICTPVGQYYSKPVNVLIQDEYFRASPGGTGSAKAAGNYGGTLYPADLAKKQGFDQILWLDVEEKKYVQEIGTMNVFFLIDGVVVTPELNDAILDGITRKSIIELLIDDGYTVEERKLSVDEIVDASRKGTLQEVFGTGTAATIAHIATLAYKEENMKLPEIDNNSIAVKVKSALEGIKRGKIEDTKGWTVLIPSKDLSRNL